MSVMEHRMQLLLDEARLTRLREKAQEQGVSVSAVVRAAIDASFEDDAAQRRAEAGRRFLELAAENVDHEPAEEPDAVERVRDDMDAEFHAKMERL